jgi:hypothetical protein
MNKNQNCHCPARLAFLMDGDFGNIFAFHDKEVAAAI